MCGKVVCGKLVTSFGCKSRANVCQVDRGKLITSGLYQNCGKCMLHRWCKCVAKWFVVNKRT